MVRRTTAVAMAFAVALAGSVLSGPVTADLIPDDTCSGSVLHSGGAMAGTVGDGDAEDWWRQPAVPGVYLVTLASTGADLSVGDGSCSSVCGSADPVLPDTCKARTTDGWLTIGVRSSSADPSAYVATASLVHAAGPTACNDRLDNDGDGTVDFPMDSGCTSVGDTSEDYSGSCFVTGHGDVCADLVKGDVVKAFTYEKPSGTTTVAEADAYLQDFRFTVLGNLVTVPCVVVATPNGSVNPCRAAGGKGVGSRTPLYTASPDAPDAGHMSPDAVRVCDQQLVVSVGGSPLPFPASVPALLGPCDAKLRAGE